MIPATTCLICGSGQLLRTRATITPFLRDRCGIEAGALALHRLYCPSCQFSFFDHRLAPEEVSRLYRDYRGEAYSTLREQYEPGWKVMPEFSPDRSNSYHSEKVRSMVNLAADWQIAPSRVLDYGGEADAWLARGAFPGALVEDFDISSASSRPERRGFDLVLCAHVLEHVSYPVPFIREVAGFLEPGGLLYLEVPFEVSDLEATQVDGHPLNRMSEHVSIFSPRSLERLMAVCGLTPVRIRNFRNPFYKATALLAKRSQDGGPMPRSGPVLEQPEAMDPPVLRRDLLGIHRQAQIWARDGIRMVIHPAGSFTMELLTYTALGESRVLALSDNDAGLRSEKRLGLPVIAPSAIPELAPDIVLIASPHYENEIAETLGWVEQHGIKLVRCSGLSSTETSAR